MANKDFLSQFSTNNKPDSFKEEERTPIENNNKKISPKAIIIGIISLVVVAAIVFVIFFMPKIKVEDFTGSRKENATAWIRQQGIETSGIIFKEEYNFDYDEGIIISQDPIKGKVTNKAKMTFVISGGPDPEESITVPDLSSMDKEEISKWIKTNKLLSTKINTTYSDTVEADGFIEAKYSGCDEDSFTRGCTLKISISKGAKPEEEIVMANFVKKTYAEFEAWATPKKIKLNKTESYSDTVDLGLIISQSVKENEKIKAGDTVNVVVSKGKGIKVPDFSTMSDSNINDWIQENNAYCKVIKKHYDSESYFISQSIKPGVSIGGDKKVTIELNLGDHFYLDELGFTIVGGSYDKFKDNSYVWMDTLGVYIDTHKNWVEDEKPAGTILGIDSIYSGSNKYSEVQRLPLEVNITVNVSSGEVTPPTPSDKIYLDYYNYIGYRLSKLNDWNVSNSDVKLKIRDMLVETKDIIDPDSHYSNREVLAIKYRYKGGNEVKDISEIGGELSKDMEIIAELGTPTDKE